MSTFAFPEDDSSELIPSTPDRRSTRSHPSTTPAGPPPSGRGLSSFTPKGLPLSSAFGSSQFGSGAAKTNRPNSFFSAQPKSSAPSVSFGATSHRNAPASSPPQPFFVEDEHEEDEDDEMGDGTIEESLANISPAYNPFKPSIRDDPFGISRGNNNMKQSTFGDSLRQSTRSVKKVEGMDIHGIAKGIAAASPSASLDDPDELILETERITEQFRGKRSRSEPTSLGDIAGQLTNVWKKFGAMSQDDVEGDIIGPTDEDAKVSRANFLSSLMILIHHPPNSMPRLGRSSRFAYDERPFPIPKVLLDWLDTYHDPSADAVSGVLEYEEGYSASPAFWDAIYLSLTRGRFQTTLKLLRGANFGVAVGGDGDSAEYNAGQLRNIDQVITQAIRLLESCPAEFGDWDIKGSDWMLFRQRVEQAKSSLRDFAEGESRHEVDEMQSSRFGRSSQNPKFSLSQASRRAESRVPFDVYEPLMDVYNQLLGTSADLLKSSFDWVEAVLALTIWWDGEDKESPNESLAASRRSLSRAQQSREVDVTPALAYRQKLSSAFSLTMSEEDLKSTFDSTDAIHVGLACIFLGDVEGLIGILRTWSMPISAALAEVAYAGGWLSEDTGARETVENFNDSDLMVLSYAGGAPGVSQVHKKDEILAEYADLLSSKTALHIPSNNTIIEGWQLALRVLGRLENFENANLKVAALLNKLSFSTNEQVDHVLELCNDLGFNNHAMSITEASNVLTLLVKQLLTCSRNTPTLLPNHHIDMATLFSTTPEPRNSKRRREYSICSSQRPWSLPPLTHHGTDWTTD
jgi:hypothetical protein